MFNGNVLQHFALNIRFMTHRKHYPKCHFHMKIYKEKLEENENFKQFSESTDSNNFTSLYYYILIIHIYNNS